MGIFRYKGMIEFLRTTGIMKIGLLLIACALPVSKSPMSGSSKVTVNSKYFILCAQTPSMKFETAEDESEFHQRFRMKAKMVLDSAKVVIEQNIDVLLKKHKLKKSVASNKLEPEKSSDAQESPGPVGSLDLLWNGSYTAEEIKTFSFYRHEFNLPLAITPMSFSSMTIMLKKDALPTKEILHQLENDVSMLFSTDLQQP